MRPFQASLPTAPATEQAVLIDGLGFRVRTTAERRAFWERVAAGHWEPQTFRAMRRFLRRDASFVDIGAWIGPTALYGARLAGRVHAVEPDPAAYAELLGNVAANPGLSGRIVLHRQCIAPAAGPIGLYAGGMYPAAASRFGDSMSGIVPAPGYAGQPRCTVAGAPLTDFLAANAIGDCGFIKMDVEGGEYSLIPGRWRDLAGHGMPPLCVSFHAPEPARREVSIGACLEELRTCYRWLYAASDGAPLDPDALLAGVDDWADEAPASGWRRFERVLGDGVVASNEAW